MRKIEFAILIRYLLHRVIMDWRQCWLVSTTNV